MRLALEFAFGEKPLMARVTRRSFLLSSAVLSVDGLRLGTAANARIGIEAQVRLPAVGQSWRYAKHDRVAGTLIDTEINRVSAVGRLIAQRARAAGVERVVFDRAGFRYHGRIKSLADAARESGLSF